MKQVRALLFLFAVISFPAFSQVSLSYSINSGTLPNDSAHITTPPTYIDTSGLYISSGFSVNTVVPDFTLYDTLGNPTTLSATLSQGKPVLLVAVSLSCPASRHCISTVLYDISGLFYNRINILLIYVVEAHPASPDFSPYANSVWIPIIDYQDSILIPQETTYGARKQNCADFINRENVNVPVLIDGPGNEYWSAFGPAANNAYLIAPNGTVFTKYGWFDQSEGSIRLDITNLLNQVGVRETPNVTSAKIYPNPSNGNSLLVVKGEGYYKFHVVDTMGRIVASEAEISSPVFDLSKYNLAAGVYSVIVETNTGLSFSLPYILQ